MIKLDCKVAKLAEAICEGVKEPKLPNSTKSPKGKGVPEESPTPLVTAAPQLTFAAWIEPKEQTESTHDMAILRNWVIMEYEMGCGGL